ncbi:hypothetical protein [Nocardia sp. NPDC003963]
MLALWPANFRALNWCARVRRINLVPMSSGWRSAFGHLSARLEGAIDRTARILHRDISGHAAHPSNSAIGAFSDEDRMAADLLRGRMAGGRTIDVCDRAGVASVLDVRRPLVEVIEGRAKKLFGHTASIARYDTRGGGRIWYSAQHHSKDPGHVQYPLIRRVFEAFVNEPNGRRRIALNEQNAFSDDAVRGLDLDDAVRQRGDHLHIRALAAHHGIRGELGDIEIAEFLTTVDPGRERLHHLWYFLNNVKHMHNQEPPPSGEKIIDHLRKWTSEHDADLRATGTWPNADGPQRLTFDDLASWYEEYLGEPFDPTKNIRDMLNPNLMDTSNPVNEILRYRNNERDVRIMDSIDGWSRQGYDVFVGQGASHYAIQKEFLQQRYGEPLIYRPGQASGNLLMDASTSSAEIRQSVSATRDRMARAENPIDEVLLSEELRVLEYELAQRP